MSAIKAPEWKLVNPKTVKFAEHNPARRTTDEAIAGLADSMSRNGLIYPIVIDSAGVIIDGHRRVAAAKMLGWESIQAIIASGDRDSIYATVNSTGKKMSGNDALGVWLKNEAAVSELQRTRFSGMRECVGTPLMKRVYKAGVAEIRTMKGSACARAIAERYGVSRSTIANIHRGRGWK